MKCWTSVVVVLLLAQALDASPTWLPRFLGGGYPRLRIGSMNIKNYGPVKADDPVKTGIIAQILGRFDVVAIQEVASKSSDVVSASLQKAMDARFGHGRFKQVVSEPLGDGSTTEKIIFVYRADKLKVTRCYLVDQKYRGSFLRSPFTCHFASKWRADVNFVYMAVHLRPTTTDTMVELNALAGVYDSVVEKNGDATAVFIMGDANADTPILSHEQLRSLKLAGLKYSWLIPHQLATMAESNAESSYDRIIMNRQYIRHIVPGSVAVWRYAEGRERPALCSWGALGVPDDGPVPQKNSTGYDEVLRRSKHVHLPKNYAQISISDHLPLSMVLDCTPTEPTLFDSVDFWRATFAARNVDIANSRQKTIRKRKAVDAAVNSDSDRSVGDSTTIDGGQLKVRKKRRTNLDSIPELGGEVDENATPVVTKNLDAIKKPVDTAIGDMSKVGQLEEVTSQAKSSKVRPTKRQRGAVKHKPIVEADTTYDNVVARPPVKKGPEFSDRIELDQTDLNGYCATGHSDLDAVAGKPNGKSEDQFGLLTKGAGRKPRGKKRPPKHMSEAMIEADLKYEDANVKPARQPAKKRPAKIKNQALVTEGAFEKDAMDSGVDLMGQGPGGKTKKPSTTESSARKKASTKAKAEVDYESHTNFDPPARSARVRKPQVYTSFADSGVDLPGEEEEEDDDDTKSVVSSEWSEDDDL